MAVEFGVVLASLMGAAAALMGGVLAQRYQYLLERQKEHFGILRDQVLAPWKRAIEARLSNLEGRDPFVVVDYVAKDYRVSPGAAVSAADQVPWSEDSRLAQMSRRHWPALWQQWDALKAEQVALGARIVDLLRKVEERFPTLPPGKEWANYPDDPAMARRMAVVNAWATHAQLFERRTYPDWVLTQLTQFGFWHGDDPAGKRDFARQVVAVLDAEQKTVGAVEAQAEALAGRLLEFAGRVEDAIQTERFSGRCGHCPRFLR